MNEFSSATLYSFVVCSFIIILIAIRMKCFDYNFRQKN